MVGWLLDTNIISEWVKPKQDRRAATFISSQPKKSVFTSRMTIVELERGIETLPDSSRKSRLSGWMEASLKPDFGSRILEVDETVLRAVLVIADVSNKKRRQVLISDAIIAATAAAHNLTIVTRNVKDFKHLDLPVFNPFTGERFNGT